ncbi:glycosyltransferase family 4 protein [Cellulomonas endophytica]|uniref:glycosyltransferase family 4 protein n=1 Tax=Cellulomonas endophytica TaxID=2494735 RepID=UPI0013E92F09|nr:glycosyltransferase family 4 protein [Cellulomonas endophytica]
MIRVAVANEYNLRDNVGRFREGRYARHLLFGVQELTPPGFGARFVGESLPGWFHDKRAARVLVTNLRGLVSGADVVYSTYTYGALLPGLVRRLVPRRRVVTLVHGLPGALRERPGLFARVFAGHDALAFLSPRDLEAVGPALRPDQDAFWVPWGASQDFLGDGAAGTDISHLLPPAARDGRPFAFAIGKSKRDWDTLVAAQRAEGFPLVVVADRSCPVQPSDSVAVHVPAAGAKEAVSLDEVRALYRCATVLVLPLVEDESLNGLTALGEALGSGSVVVMTSTRAMGPFAPLYPGWVVPVPPQDGPAMGTAIAKALVGPLPQERPALPTAERFERLVLGVLAGRRSTEVAA